MTNLLKETTEALAEHNLTFEDVEYIVLGDTRLPIDTFKQGANHLYDNGYGATVIPMNLYIVGDEWWLEREEYDGAEWWEYKEKPKCPKEVAKEFVW